MHPLKKALFGLACALLCLLCVCTVLLFSILMDVKRQVTAVREQTTKVARGLEHIQSALAALDDPTLARVALAKGVKKLPVDLPQPAGSGESTVREIAHLLQCVGRPGLVYDYEGKQRPAEWVQMKLNAKAILLGNVFPSAEEFIDKVATRTGEGSVYHVTDGQAAKVELQAWLRARLQEYRSTGEAME